MRLSLALKDIIQEVTELKFRKFIIRYVLKYFHCIYVHC